MLQHLDPRSLIAMSAFLSLFMATALLLMWRNYPPSIRGLGLWGAAPLLWAFSAVLFAGRDVLPLFWSIVVPNQLLLLGTLLFYIGIRRFHGHGGGWRVWGSILIASGVVFTWLTYTTEYAVRLVVFTSLAAALHLTQLHFLLRHGGRAFPVRLVEGVLLVQSTVLLSRLVAVFTGHTETNLLTPSLLQTLYVGAYTFTALMLSIGSVLMAIDRLRTELEHLATHDSLTQALNRRAMLQECETELARAQRQGNGPSMMMLDLDHFKAVNDTYGHQHGDAVLVHFVDCIRATLRQHDRVGRYGGEEFLVMLPETRAADAVSVAERMHTALASGHALDCKVSIGVTAWTGAQDTLDAMLGRADAALYAAKRNGRDQTQVG